MTTMVIRQVCAIVLLYYYSRRAQLLLLLLLLLLTTYYAYNTIIVLIFIFESRTHYVYKLYYYYYLLVNCNAITSHSICHFDVRRINVSCNNNMSLARRFFLLLLFSLFFLFFLFFVFFVFFFSLLLLFSYFLLNYHLRVSSTAPPDVVIVFILAPRPPTNHRAARPSPVTERFKMIPTRKTFRASEGS